MSDSPENSGDGPEQDGETQPSAAELEAAGQSALFGDADSGPAPEPEPESQKPEDQKPAGEVPAQSAAEPQPQPQPATPADQPYRVLARKYRPQTFTELIGQEAMVQTLANAIKRDRLAHAFLMTGVRGVGKTSTARLIAKALNCIGSDGQGGPTIDPCGQCEPCIAIAEGRHIDVIEMDAASHTGVDDVREIIEAVRYAAVSARYKIYIIDEVHMLTRNAFNALLKTLEEPPAHVKFLFATTEVGKLPVTVLSRCQRFDLKRIQAPMLADHFSNVCGQEGIEAEAEALAMIAAAAEGSVRDGLSILDQAIAHADLDAGGKVGASQVREMLGLADKGAQRSLLSALLEGDGKTLLELVERQFALGVEPLSLMRGTMELVHRITVTQISGAVADAASAEEREALQDWSRSLKAGQLHRLWQLLLKGQEEVRSAPDPLVAAKMALLRAMHASDMPDPGDLVNHLESLAANQPQPGQTAPSVSGVDSAEAPAGKRPDWAALVTQIKDLGEVHLASQMRLQVRVVDLEAGTLRYSQAPGFREDISADLRAGLLKLTRERWAVERVAEDGAPTLEEAAQDAARLAEEANRADPVVQAAIAAFPDAELISDEDDLSRRAGAAGGWQN